MAYSPVLSEKLAPTVTGLGYELLGVDVLSGNRGKLLRCYIDRAAGITVDDCERVSRQLSDLIEAEQLVRDAYTLEVSSPGVDRPLFTGAQMAAHVGQAVEVRLSTLTSGRRKIEGELLGVEGDFIKIAESDEEFEIPLRLVEKAKLVFRWTD